MNTKEKSAIYKHLWKAVEIEYETRVVRALELSAQNLNATDQESQQDDNIVLAIDDCSAHVVSFIKKRSEKLECFRHEHLEALSKYPDIIVEEFLANGHHPILTWHIDLLKLWNKMKISQNDLQSHEVRVKELLRKLENLSSLIHEDFESVSRYWQKQMIISIWRLIKLVQKLKNVHNVKVEIESAMDPTLNKRLSRVSNRIDEVENHFSANHEEVKKVKETFAHLLPPDPTVDVFARGCSKIAVAVSQHFLADFIDEQTKAIFNKLDTYGNTEIQKITTDLSQLRELIKVINFSPTE